MALRDPRAPWCVKALAVVAVLYVVSPFDLLPDFIPFHGALDDIVVIPLAVAMMVHLIPLPLKAELQEKAEARMAERGPRNRLGEAIILFCLVGIAAVIAWLIWGR